MSEKIAVAGAGLMGQGIAQIFAAHGHAVRLYDIAQDALSQASGEIARIGELIGSASDTLSRIAMTTDFAFAVDGADVVIEAAAEKLEVKQQIFAQLDALCPADTILASNTSVIPISRIAEPVADKSRVMGMHFWNPPYVVPLVEVIEIDGTSARKRDAIVTLLRTVGQEPVVVRRDIPGFIGNRLQHALKREAIALVAAGVCDAETVDRVIKLGFGARLGVLGTLEQSDMVGLNLTLDIHKVVIADLDVTPGPHPYLEDLVAQGHLGMKTGQGFHKWTEESAREVRDNFRAFLAAQAERRRQNAE